MHAIKTVEFSNLLCGLTYNCLQQFLFLLNGGFVFRSGSILDSSELDSPIFHPPFACGLAWDISGKGAQGLGIGRVLFLTTRDTQGGEAFCHLLFRETNKAGPGSIMSNHMRRFAPAVVVPTQVIIPNV